MTVPLVILAILSILGGFVELPEALGGRPLFSDFLQTVFGADPIALSAAGNEILLQVIASIISLAGIFTAYLFFLRRPEYADNFASLRAFESVRKFWLAGWGFDAMYDRLFIRPFLRLTEINKRDFIDSGYAGIAVLNRILSTALAKTQTGNIRWYAMGIAMGAVVFLGMILLLQ